MAQMPKNNIVLVGHAQRHSTLATS
jgi:hypothetical protein